MKGKNSYYAIQLIESDKLKNDYHVFRKWGRVGTEIGGNKVFSFRFVAISLLPGQNVFLSKALFILCP
jgi:hypothetical protein